jgi:acyl-coenzyme A synthetase/AMP-(fatty) acid ligase
MYTSGSTGIPKSVWQNHCGIVHDADVYSEMIQLGPEDRLSLLPSCSFAAASIPLFTALLNGATLCPFHVRSQGVERLAIWLRERGITIYDSVPTVFRHLARVTDDNVIFALLRLVRLAGEPVLHGDLEIFPAALPGPLPVDECASFNRNGPYLHSND